ncbi:MAG: hypothetical protein HQK94_18365 [Nitrospirae bacterium]|nr:hypothetical protein [Nitrospirota bacterium]
MKTHVVFLLVLLLFPVMVFAEEDGKYVTSSGTLFYCTNLKRGTPSCNPVNSKQDSHNDAKSVSSIKRNDQGMENSHDSESKAIILKSGKVINLSSCFYVSGNYYCETPGNNCYHKDSIVKIINLTECKQPTDAKSEFVDESKGTYNNKQQSTSTANRFKSECKKECASRESGCFNQNNQMHDNDFNKNMKQEFKQNCISDFNKCETNCEGNACFMHFLNECQKECAVDMSLYNKDCASTCMAQRCK